MQDKKLIVGLGNIGKEYKQTRHNTGFILIDNIVKNNWEKFKNSLVSKYNNNIIIAKPTTFMNSSGMAVKELINFYKISLNNLIVIHDDMDIKLGEFKIKTGGSSAGHNGIKSIDSHCGNEYKRIRIGISHPRILGINIKPANFVLNNFTIEELNIIINLSEKIKTLIFDS